MTFGYSAAKGASADAGRANGGGAGAGAGAGAGYFYVVGRHDDRVFTPKGDCGFNAAKDGDWPTRACPGGVNETVHGLWRAPMGSADAPALGRFVHVEWRITWAAFAATGGVLRDGVVTVLLDGKLIVDGWRGPIGRNDGGRAPYFKIGIYNPSGNGQTMRVAYANFSQSWAFV